MHKNKRLSIEERKKRQEIRKEWYKKIKLTICFGSAFLVIGILLSIFFPETVDGTGSPLSTLALVFTATGSGLLALCIYRWHEIPLEQLTEEDLKKREILFLFLSAIFIVLLAITPFLNEKLLKQVLHIISTSGLGVSINLVICTFDSRMDIEEKRLIKELRKAKYGTEDSSVPHDENNN